MSIYTLKFPSTKPMPYVYRLDNLATGEFYIGSRWKNYTKLNLTSSADLGVVYFTSSNIVIPRFDEFTYIILAETYTPQDAYTIEQQLICENWNNPLLLNKRFYLNGVIQSRQNYESIERNSKISKKMTGTTSVKDENGITFKVKITDPRYINGELFGVNKGKTGLTQHLNSQLKICEKCGVECSLGNYAKFHGENCGQPFPQSTIEKMKSISRNRKTSFCAHCNKEIGNGSCGWQKHIKTEKHLMNVTINSN